MAKCSRGRLVSRERDYSQVSDSALLANFAAQVILDSERGLLEWSKATSAMAEAIQDRMADTSVPECARCGWDEAYMP